MERFVITVNRQFGSYGRAVARRLGELLNIPCYDSELIKEAAEELDMAEELIEQSEETAIRQPKNVSKTFILYGPKATDTQEQIFETQASYIREVTAKGSCIIVGRCSDYVLLEEKNALHIYIYASYSARIKYCMDVLGQDKSEAGNTLRKVDQLRLSYHMQFAGYLPDDKDHKDILIDSSTFGIEETARLLAQAVKIKFGL